ncbi:MAG: hypothetical protein ACREBG_13675 [Pyrinomonadaceae bacterium]
MPRRAFLNTNEASSTAVSSKLLAAAERPTRPLYFAASMFGDLQFSFSRTGREKLADSFGKLFYIALVQLRSSFSFPLGATLSGFRVGQAFSFGLVQCALFNQQSLTLVSPTRLTELKNHR